MTEVEFLSRTARALLPGEPQHAVGFTYRALGLTVDPRLRSLTTPAVSLQRDDAAAARRCLDRAVDYDQTRRTAKTRL